MGRAIVTRRGGVVISAVLSSPPRVFLQRRVRSGCDRVTCWDGACPCHCLAVMEWLAHGAFVSTVLLLFFAQISGACWVPVLSVSMGGWWREEPQDVICTTQGLSCL